MDGQPVAGKMTAHPPLPSRSGLRHVLWTALLLTPMPWASGHNLSADAEIAHLIKFLEQCGCQFNRNGSLHSDREAAAHLREKWDYLSRKGQALAADQFIADVASKSSFSGKPYLVQCKGVQPVESGKWLTEELQRYRQRTATVSDPASRKKP